MLTRETLNRQQLLWLLVAIALAMLPHASHLPLPLSIWFFAILGWRLLGVWRPDQSANSALRLISIGIGLALLIGFRPEHWGAESGAALFVVAVAVKLLEFDHRRDAYFISYLGLLLIGAQFLFRQDVLMTGYGLTVCWLLLSALLSVNGPMLCAGTVVRRSGVMLLQALPLALVLFLLFPRMQAPAWGWLDASRQAKTGLSETLETGSINRLALSPELVFRVEFDGDRPPTSQLYWRGPVYSFTDGKVWTIREDDYALQFQDELTVSGKAYRYKLLLESQQRNWVYALDMPAEYETSAHRNAGYQLIGHHKAGEAAEYSMVSYPQYNTGLITKIEYRQNRQLPAEPSERVIELVRQLGGFDADPKAYMDNVLDYFRRQHFSYTLNPPLMEDRPIETFLFEAKSGFCNHFATAFAYLMRVADIPARVVGGYQGGDYNEVGHFLEVRQANAHAWAEVWLRGKGWVRVDPTTAVLPQRVEQAVNVERQIESGAVSLADRRISQDAGLSRIPQLINSLDYQWQRWVVRFGSEKKPLQLGHLDINELMPRIYGLLVGGGLAMLMLMRGVLREGGENRPAEVKLYRRFCQKMAKFGVAIRPGEGASDFAARAKAEKPELSDWINDVTQGFVRLRYYRQPDTAELRRLQKSINKEKGFRRG